MSTKHSIRQLTWLGTIALSLSLNMGAAFAQVTEAESIAALAIASADNTATVVLPVLPPVLEWSGESEHILDNIPTEWRTPIEQTQFVSTPDYEQTLTFLRKLNAASANIQMQEIGRSAQGRPLYVVIASLDPEKDLAKRRRSERVRVLMQAGIHAGEIDGKDAGLLLLRDFVRGKQLQLLKNTDWYFIPVLNVDGHEKPMQSAYANHRVNQRGPDKMGWRTNANNLNLNRDFMKLDTPEVQAVVKLINTIDAELFVDIHVTDGIDYQYDITYGFNTRNAQSVNIGEFMKNRLRPFVDQQLSLQGHIPGDLIFAIDSRDMNAGLIDWTASPRYSHGYGDWRGLPSILVENHSLKPYRQRVLGTYAFISKTLELAGRERSALRSAIQKDRVQLQQPGLVDSTVHLAFSPAPEALQTLDFLGVKSELFDSPITGAKEIRWLGEAERMQITVLPDKPMLSVNAPRAYWIPAQWKSVIEVLRKHGVVMEEIKIASEKSLQFYRLPDAKIHAQANEGRVGLTPGVTRTEQLSQSFLPGSVRVSTQQPLARVVVCLLEPQCGDSLFAWGYFHGIMQETEYFEGYVGEPMALQMLAQDENLRAEFAKALENSGFASDPQQRLEWFYRRSPFHDHDYRLYPIGREL